MSSPNNIVLSADVMTEGLLVSFKDGRYAIYSGELLVSMIAQAKSITPDPKDDDPL